MLEVGKEIIRDGKTYCVLDFLRYHGKNYVLFSVEDNKIDYVFYEIVSQDEKGYNLELVTDRLIKSVLFGLFEDKEENK